MRGPSGPCRRVHIPSHQAPVLVGGDSRQRRGNRFRGLVRQEIVEVEAKGLFRLAQLPWLVSIGCAQALEMREDHLLDCGSLANRRIVQKEAHPTYHEGGCPFSHKPPLEEEFGKP